MKPNPRLLDHPFYKAWRDGEVTVDQLARYGDAYKAFMAAIPGLWARIGDELKLADTTIDMIVDEERVHADLWDQWTDKLPAPDSTTELSDLLDGLDGLHGAALAGAIHAYEVQQQDVSRTKRAGLIEYYGFEADDVDFFDAHIEDEDAHIAYGRQIGQSCDDPQAFEAGFAQGADLVYHSLDRFV